MTSNIKAFGSNFLGNAPDWYKITVIAFLLLNPLLLVALGPYVTGWVIVGEFIFTLAMAGGLVAIMFSFLLAPIARRIDGRAGADYGRARVLAWIGGALSLGGLVLAVQTVLDTGQYHPASLVVGVPSSIAWAGWLGLAGFILCLAAVWRMVSAGNGGQALGTRLALGLTALLTGGLLWFLFSIGAGPF